jgi:branched-subunit amino acid transport protein
VTEVWITIAVLAVATAAIKTLPPLHLGGRPLPPRVTAVIALLAPALLSALVVVETFSHPNHDLVVDERALGVAAAAGVMAWRRDLIMAVVVAAVVTALARALL